MHGTPSRLRAQWNLESLIGTITYNQIIDNQQGQVIVVRYADDAVLGFQHRADAERFLEDWRERLRKFGLELHPDKTRLIEFGRFVAASRKLRGKVIYALYHHVRLLSPEPMVVDKPQSTRVEADIVMQSSVFLLGCPRSQVSG
jgi:hypothetical protein